MVTYTQGFISAGTVRYGVRALIVEAVRRTPYRQFLLPQWWYAVQPMRLILWKIWTHKLKSHFIARFKMSKIPKCYAPDAFLKLKMYQNSFSAVWNAVLLFNPEFMICTYQEFLNSSYVHITNSIHDITKWIHDIMKWIRDIRNSNSWYVHINNSNSWYVQITNSNSWYHNFFSWYHEFISWYHELNSWYVHIMNAAIPNMYISWILD